MRSKDVRAAFVLLMMGAQGCAPAAMTMDAGDAAVMDQRSPSADVMLNDTSPAPRDAVPDRVMTCSDCGPHGHSHGDHCHCDPGYVERDRCCVPAPPCSMPDDMLEENDTVEQATPVMPPMYMQNMLRVCPADEDVFRVPLRMGQRVQVNVTFRHAMGDVDAYLFGPGATDLGHSRPVAGSDGTEDNESFSYTAAMSGDHHLLIVGHNGAENTYGLQITVSGP